MRRPRGGLTERRMPRLACRNVHPRTWPGQATPVDRRHEISLTCDDLDATIADLRSRGAEFDGDIWEREYGRGLNMLVPGMDPLMIYQPSYVPAWGARS